MNPNIKCSVALFCLCHFVINPKAQKGAIILDDRYISNNRYILKTNV